MGTGSLAPLTNQRTFAISFYPTRTLSPGLTLEIQAHSLSLPLLINVFFDVKERD